MVSDKGVLYIEPSKNISTDPVIDTLTRKMTAALRKATRDPRSWRGWHTCACGANSVNHDFVLPNGEQTNSLCVHYLAYHRDEVPAAQLQKVSMLNCGEEDPNDKELRGWCYNR